MGVWSGGRVWIFSICWFQWYKCSHLANFSYLGDITECGVGENVHKHHSWAGASLSYSKLAPTHTHHCMGPCPRFTESQPWGLGPGSLSFNRPSRLLRGSQKFAKHCVCVVCKNHLGSQQAPRFPAEVKVQSMRTPKWATLLKPQILLHKGSTGVGGRVLQCGNSSVESTDFKAEIKKDSNNTFEERPATGITKIWKNEFLVNPRIPEENCSEVSCELAKK